MRIFGQIVISVIALVLLALNFGLDGVFVAFRAESLAGERPYCISTASENAAYYVQAARVEDLGFRYMFNSRSLTEEPGRGGNHHAIIEVKEPLAFLNWSYQAMGFVPEVVDRERFFQQGGEIYRPQMNCIPAAHFAKNLRFF